MNYSLFIALLVISPFNWASSVNAPLPLYSQTYDPSRDAFKDAHAAIQLAQNTDRRILIEVGGDWCSWCHRLDNFLNKNPDIKQQLHKTFVLLKVNVSEENDNSQFLSAFPRPLGYPHMYVAENNGSILWSKDTADFISKGQYSRENFQQFFNRWAIRDSTQSLKVSQQ